MPRLVCNGVVLASSNIPFKEFSQTLSAGSTEITFQDNVISTYSTIDIDTTPVCLNPTAVVISQGSATIEFPEQDVDITVRVRVS